MSLPPELRWYERAACIRADPSLFDPPGSGRMAVALTGRDPQVERALTYCRRCPARPECLNDAIKHADSGVRGGQLLTRGNVKPGGTAPCGTAAAYRNHERHGDPIDDACRTARNEADQARRDRKRTAA